MAIYRNIQLSFWTDNKVVDDFTPEDKYFYLYLLTNPQTNLCGCYEISYKSMVDDTGYNKDTCLRLLERFEKIHKIIRFNEVTKEVLILNWYKYNWSKSPKTLTGAENFIKHVKCAEFRSYLFRTLECVAKGEIPSEYDEESHCSMDITMPKTQEADNEELETIKNVVKHLNEKCGTKYSSTTPNTKKRIRARIKEGYSEEDFITVIDKKADEWLGTEQEKYLRPDTLFGTKFESYLNQKIIKGKSQNPFDEWRGA